MPEVIIFFGFKKQQTTFDPVFISYLGSWPIAYYIYSNTSPGYGFVNKRAGPYITLKFFALAENCHIYTGLYCIILGQKNST